MKPGAGDDPFAEESQDGPAESADEEPSEPDEDVADSTEVGEGERDGEEAESTSSTEPTADGDDASGIPWVLRRSSVKQSRDNVHQFFLRNEYSRREDDIIEEVAELLDLRQKDVMKLDVREAMVATADPKAIAETLEDWGYEYKE